MDYIKYDHKKIKFCISILLTIALSWMSSYYFIKYINLSNQWMIPMIFTCGMLIIFFFILAKNEKINDKNFLAFLILFAIIIRYIFLLIIKTVPISDFSIPHQVYILWNENVKAGIDPLTNMSRYVAYYSRFPAWYTYLKIVFFVYNIFQYNPEIFKIINIILNVLSIIFMYYGIKEFFGSLIAKTSAAIFAFCPSLILYINVTTPDHFALLFICLLILFWSQMYRHQSQNNTKETIIYSLLTIVSAVIINLFKPVAIYYLVTFICIEGVVHILPNILSIEKLKKIFKMKLKYWIAFSLTFIVCLSAANKIIEYSLQKMFKTEIVDSTYLYVLYGYSLNDRGHYDVSVADKVIKDVLERHGTDMKGAMEEIEVIAKKQLKNNKSQMPKIFWEKLSGEYMSERSYWNFSCVSKDSEYSNDLKVVLYNPILASMQFYMFIIFILVVISVIKIIFKMEFNKGYWLMLFMSLGYTLILILGGVQGRYKILIMPQLSVLAAYGMYYTDRVFNLIKCKVKRQ